MTGYPCAIVALVIVFIAVIGYGTYLLDRLPEQVPGGNFQARNWPEMQANGALRWMKAILEERESDEDDAEEKVSYRYSQNEPLFIIWETCPKGAAKADCSADPFSDSVLKKIAEVEKMLVKWDKWEAKYCSLHELEKNDTHARCFAPLSFMNYVHQDEDQVAESGRPAERSC